ncbi:unnamed protein product, partial [Phaeothamnion confervicola]
MKKKVLLLLFTVVSICCYGQNNTNTGTNAGNSGSDNTSIGYKAGDLVEGAFNTFLGSYSGKSQVNGTYNTFLGAYSGYIT